MNVARMFDNDPRSTDRGFTPVKGEHMKRWLVALVALLGVTMSSRTYTDPQVQLAVTGTWCAHQDSIALYGGSSGTGYLTDGYAHPLGHYYPTEHGWFANVVERAEVEWPGFAWRNYSMNGASVATFLPGGAQETAVQDTWNRDPNVAFLALGTNEFLGGVPASTFQANLNALITRIKSGAPGTSLVILRQWYTPHHPRLAWTPYADAMQAVATSRGLNLVDVGAAFHEMEYGVADESGLYHSDRIHLSTAGNYVYASVVYDSLKFTCN